MHEPLSECEIGTLRLAARGCANDRALAMTAATLLRRYLFSPPMVLF